MLRRGTPLLLVHSYERPTPSNRVEPSVFDVVRGQMQMNIANHDGRIPNASVVKSDPRAVSSFQFARVVNDIHFPSSHPWRASCGVACSVAAAGSACQVRLCNSVTVRR
jgi:hypothetical protein